MNTSHIHAVAVREADDLTLQGPAGIFAVRPIWHDRDVTGSRPLLGRGSSREPDGYGVYEVDARGLQHWRSDWTTLADAIHMASVYAGVVPGAGA